MTGRGSLKGIMVLTTRISDLILVSTISPDGNRDCFAGFFKRSEYIHNIFFSELSVLEPAGLGRDISIVEKTNDKGSRDNGRTRRFPFLALTGWCLANSSQATTPAVGIPQQPKESLRDSLNMGSATLSISWKNMNTISVVRHSFPMSNS